AAGPGGAEAAGEVLARRVARTGEGEDRPSLPFCDLRDDMRGGAEAVEAETPALAGDDQRAPADEPGAEQRGERDIAAVLPEREGIARIGDGRRRESPVAAIAGEERVVAEILLAAGAIGADAAATAEPGHADAVAEAQPDDAGAHGIDPADDL